MLLGVFVRPTRLEVNQHLITPISVQSAGLTTYKSSGFNLRRIVRDQNSKVISGLNQVRQQQLGITQYVWRSVQDERTRPTHAANDGRTFEWGSPPADTGHPGDDVMCRCLAEAVITPSKAQAWGASAPAA